MDESTAPESSQLLIIPSPRRRREAPAMPVQLTNDVAAYLAIWLEQLRVDVRYRVESIWGFYGCMLPRDPHRDDNPEMQLYMARALVYEMDDEECPGLDDGVYLRLLPGRRPIRFAPLERVPSRPVVSRLTRDTVLVRDGGRCRYCGDRAPQNQLDHVVPFVAGGPTTGSNLVLACEHCNKSKGTQLWIPVAA